MIIVKMEGRLLTNKKKIKMEERLLQGFWTNEEI
jgi:hypothetical protein